MDGNMLIEGMTRTAELSPCRRYRYTLGRRWGPKPGCVPWIMNNPSVADAEIDDPSSRRCMAFTQRFGYDAMVVVNRFAYRATDPADLLDASREVDVMGPKNGLWVRRACHQAAFVIVAWGALKKPLQGSATDIVKVILDGGYKLKCLGTTKDGQPRHPLYVAADVSLVDWRAP